MSSDWFVEGPSGRRLEEQKAVIYTLPRARRKALEKARKDWPEAQLEDFEQDGKAWVHRESGVVYGRVPGDPMLGGAQREDVETFFLTGDGHVVYLRRAGDPGHVTRQVQGEVSVRRATAADFIEAYTETRQ